MDEIKNSGLEEAQVEAVDHGKRNFIKKASYVAPTVLTLSAIPSFASAGSGYQSPSDGGGNGYQPGDFWRRLIEWLRSRR